MDYDKAKQVGDRAEARVAAVLAELKLKHGFLVLHDVLIVREQAKGKPITAQLDHVVIDKMGVLVIETKVRTGAQLRGTYADSNWTACYPSKKKASFQNPLRQNEQHLNLLHQLLKESEPALSLDAVRGCVVFVDTDISHLELDSVTSRRVRRIEDLAAWFDDRDAFATMTPLSPQAQSALGSSVLRLDRSNDPPAVAAHAAYRQGGARSAGKTGQPAAARAQRPAQARVSAPYRTTSQSHTASESLIPESQISRRIVLIVILLVAAVLFGAWVVHGIMYKTAPTWVYVMVFLVLAVIGGETNGRSRRRYQGASRSKSAPATFGQRLVALGLMLALVAGLALAAPWLLRQVTASLAPSSPIAAPTTTSPASAVNVEQARRALQDSAPNIYAGLVNPNSPTASVDGANVSYEWEYLDKGSAASVQVKKVKITLDAAGRIIGVTGS